MTGFSVDPGAVRQLAALVDRACEDVDDTKTHLARMADFYGADGEGLLNMTLDSHHVAHQAVSDWLDNLRTTLGDVSAAAADSATYYEQTDANAAAQLDAAYPPADVDDAKARTDIPVSDESGLFAGDARPALAEPGNYDDLMCGGLPKWWDSLSPMAWAGFLIENVSKVAVLLGWLDAPFNPQQRIAMNFIGDWPAVRETADVLHNVAAAASTIANTVRIGALDTDRVWQGNSGDNAAVYLLNLATPIDAAAPVIDKLAKAYKTTAEEMTTLRDAVVSVVEFTGDAAIAAMVGVYIAQNLYASFIGSPLAALITAYAGWRIVEVIDGITTMIGLSSKLALATNVLKAAQQDIAGVGTAGLPALPDSPLTNIPGR